MIGNLWAALQALLQHLPATWDQLAASAALLEAEVAALLDITLR